jgi:hypothetical protein
MSRKGGRVVDYFENLIISQLTMGAAIAARITRSLISSLVTKWELKKGDPTFGKKIEPMTIVAKKTIVMIIQIIQASSCRSFCSPLIFFPQSNEV